MPRKWFNIRRNKCFDIAFSVTPPNFLYSWRARDVTVYSPLSASWPPCLRCQRSACGRKTKRIIVYRETFCGAVMASQRTWTKQPYLNSLSSTYKGRYASNFAASNGSPMQCTPRNSWETKASGQVLNWLKLTRIPFSLQVTYLKKKGKLTSPWRLTITKQGVGQRSPWRCMWVQSKPRQSSR